MIYDVHDLILLTKSPLLQQTKHIQYYKTATQCNPTKHNSKSGDKVLFLIYFNSTPNASECAAADRCAWVFHMVGN